MAQKPYLTREQFMRTCDELYENAKRLVARLEGFNGHYWTHLSEADALILAGDAHQAHKAAISIRDNFKD